MVTANDLSHFCDARTVSARWKCLTAKHTNSGGSARNPAASKHSVDDVGDQSSEQFVWIQTTNIHATLEDQDLDIGRDNAKVLICRDFRYFEKDAVEILD